MSILAEPKFQEMKERLLKEGVVSITGTAPFNLKSPRLVNAFSLGCDPEFMLLRSAVSGGVVSASGCGLKVDEAFGCDGAGTPVELRAHPSRFAIEVTASLLNTLRWMYLRNEPASTCHMWAAGSHIDRYSLGGHVHMGRKGGKRPAEISALDSVCKLLEKAGQQMGNLERRTNSGYGHWGDYRQQAWGYEYRAFGCFLYSPAVAHLLLTLAKLAVVDPSLGKLFQQASLGPSSQARLAIIKTLGLFRFVDDDASIAYRGLSHTLTGAISTNILSTWGIKLKDPLHKGTVEHVQKVLMPTVPSTIPGDAAAKEEVVQSILTGAPPVFRIPSRTWGPVLPALAPELIGHFTPIVPHLEFFLGERELLSGLYTLRGTGVSILPTTGHSNDYRMTLGPDFRLLLTRGAERQIDQILSSIGCRRETIFEASARLSIGLGREMRHGAPLRAVKRLLASGVLPVVSAENASLAWVELWRKRLRKAGVIA